MAVMLTDVSDRVVCKTWNPVKVAEKVGAVGQESEVWEVVYENHRLGQLTLYS